MTEHVASRTLVKSPPELWAECSDAASLARHLDQFGDIKITRLDPEIAVAWEGERARGTVRIEPAGWGTKVILTAEAMDEEKPEEAPAVVEVAEVEGTAVVEVAEVETIEVVEVVQVVEPEVDVPDAPHAAQTTPAAHRRRFPRLFRFRRVPRATQPAVEPEEPASEPESAAQAEPEPAAEEPATDTAPETTEAALTAALDSLGQAHHRPYSRA